MNNNVKQYASYTKAESLGSVRFFMFFLKGCIYLIKITIKNILKHII